MRNLIIVVATALPVLVSAQQPVAAGGGSYAEYAPLYKSKTDQHSGDKSRIMETRRIFVSESKHGEPLPTNDWWTNLLVDSYSGNLWTYPQVVKAEDYGISVSKINHWSSDGCEMKFDTFLKVKGLGFHPAEAVADDWSDWGLRMRLADGGKSMNVTMAQGVPFTWVEVSGLDLTIDTGGGTVSDENGTEVTESVVTDRLSVKINDDVYGIYVPDGTRFEEREDGFSVRFPENGRQYISIAVLPDAGDLDFYAGYAAVVPRHTEVTWKYDEKSGEMTSTWSIDSENLDGSSEKDIMQGFLPHHYKSYSKNDIAFTDYSYATPRGVMKMAVGHRFSTSYRFSGMLPWIAAPVDMPSLANPYDRARMKQMISDYASKGNFGADTYWGGKGLIQMALYMTFAREMGENELFEQCRSRLRAVMEDWLTYTPGEKSFFFARSDRWGAMVGYDTSYDSETFNDHHFHYGYFTYAGALLALVDSDFKDKYGEMLKLIAKDYANWDKDDKRFPFMRTFSPWSGHSYAGGLGNTGNGNGQESSSEAMQGWGGMYLLGEALGDKDMRDAGIFGWVTESKGIAEYWFDRDRENINRSLYTKPYNSNLTAAGIGWWTWFSGDPVWMHSIQWMPISPCLDYLSEDLDFAKWDYEQMWAGKEIGGWEADPSYSGSALSKESGLGNVVLSYLQRFDPDQAAEVMDEMWNSNAVVARATDTNGISYYITHSHRSYGDRDFSVNADIPTSSAYLDKSGTYTYVVYNPESSERKVSFFKNGAEVVSFVAPAGRMTVYRESPVATQVKISKPRHTTVEPGQALALTAAVLDQYGATMKCDDIVWTAGEGGTIDADGTFHAGTEKLESCEVKAAYAGMEDRISLRIDDAPVLDKVEVSPAVDYAIAGQRTVFSLLSEDQYGEVYPLEHSWEIRKDGNVVATDSILDTEEIGVYTVAAIAENGKEYSREIYYTPQMDNLALNKPADASSEENSGLLKGYVNDGDLSTRWSSRATDDEWVSVDLGKTAFVNSVKIFWETAYASRYTVDVSLDGSEWTTVKEIAGGGGQELTVVGRNARYVRVRGLARATDYGYSIWDMEVYGIDPDTPVDDLMGIEIKAPTELVTEGEPVMLSVDGFNGRGEKTEVGNVVWNVDKAYGTITADGLFTPSGYGVAEVTAEAQGKKAVKQFVIAESIKVKSAEISPSVIELPLGESVEFSLKAFDQFSAECTADGFSFVCREADDMISGNTFTALRKGEYEIVAGNGDIEVSAKVTVRDFRDTNLALNKKVYASSYENDGTRPSFVNDGDLATRWGSRFADNQYVVVDLGASYMVNHVVINWNAGAYSTDYRIELSEDEDEWIPVSEKTDSEGGLQDHFFSAVSGRYIRIYCMHRANIYGSCIDELEVYGQSRSTSGVHGLNEKGKMTVVVENGELVVRCKNMTSVSVHDVSGRCVRRSDDINADEYRYGQELTRGIYIVSVTAADGSVYVEKVML